MTRKGIHDSSSKLEDSENKLIFEKVEKTNGIVCSTAIVQLWLSKKPEHREFFKRSVGVLCLVKEFLKDTYHFRVYDLKAELLWEHEFYLKLDYQKVTDNFYYFPAEDCNAGFNFAFTDEAQKFDKAIDKIHIEQRTKFNISLASLPIVMDIPKEKVPEKKDSSWYSSLKKLASSDTIRRKTPVKKIDIGTPINPVHITHVATEGSFDRRENVDENDPMKSMMEFLKSNNIKATKKTLRVADEFIKNNGGYEKFKDTYEQKVASRQAPPVPQQNHPRPQVQTTTRQPPPRPVINTPPVIPNRSVTNPVVPTATPIPIQSAPIPGPGLAPPPPPPLNLDLTNPPINQNPVAAPKSVPVEINTPKPPASDSWLDSIKNFKKESLTSAKVEVQSVQENKNEGEQDIVDQLHSALMNMRQFIEDDDDDNEDSEW